MIRLAIRAPAEAAEQVLAAVLELSPAGVEEVQGEGFVEYAIYGAPGELPALPQGRAEVAGTRVEVRGEEVPDDWAERWKRFHGAVLVGGRLYVRPPWEPAAVRPGVHEIVIDPGRAFGTGSHPTTRLCLELLLDLAGRRTRPRSLVDLGCGSGILAIAAAKLGFAPVAALDCDPASLEATERNARENGVELAQVQRIDLREEPAPQADVVVANLTGRLLLRVAELMADPPPAIVAAGLLETEADAVAAAFAPLRERRQVALEGWTGLLLAH